jgi:LacI family transcriptional regulator
MAEAALARWWPSAIGGAMCVTTRPATMKDVAALAGVAIKTVSRVVNGEPNVGVDTRARIEAAIEQLNYRHNAAASFIRRRSARTASVGLIVEDLANPFAAVLARVVRECAQERQHLVLIGSSDGVPQRERELVTRFVSRRVDGLVIMPAQVDGGSATYPHPSKGCQSYLERERARGVPVVFVDRPGRGIEADTVLSDNANSMHNAVRHLAEHGHRSIGYIGDRRRLYTAAQRIRGYRAGMRALTGHVDERYVITDVRTRAEANRAAAALLDLDPPPTALLCGSDLLTSGALQVLQARGLRDTVAVVGFDDYNLAELLAPALTVLDMDIATLGRLATERLFQRLAGDVTDYERLVVPMTLIPRGSGEIPPPALNRLEKVIA